jgi:hypothetical protein
MRTFRGWCVTITLAVAFFCCLLEYTQAQVCDNLPTDEIPALCRD